MRLSSGVATAAEAGVEAALIGVLRHSSGPVRAVEVVSAATVAVGLAVTVAVGLAVTVAVGLAVTVAAPAVVVAERGVGAVLGIRSVLVARPESAAVEASSEPSRSESVTAPASTGERGLLVPAESAGDLLERGDRGREVFG
jgi:hypothetical protein